MDEEKKEELPVTDINLAAALLTNVKDAYLDESRTDWTDPRHVEVTIVGNGLMQVKKRWADFDLQVNARIFCARLKDVKAHIHSKEGRDGRSNSRPN